MALITKARKEKSPPLAQNMFPVQSTACRRQIIECGTVYVSLWNNYNFLCNTSYCVLIFQRVCWVFFSFKRRGKTVLTPHFHLLHTFYAQWRADNCTPNCVTG